MQNREGSDYSEPFLILFSDLDFQNSTCSFNPLMRSSYCSINLSGRL